MGTTEVFHFSIEDHNRLTEDAFVTVEVVDGDWSWHAAFAWAHGFDPTTRGGEGKPLPDRLEAVS